MGLGRPVARSYERICFDKNEVDGHPSATFVYPGHPLLDATLDLVLERHRDLLKRGAILVDEADPREEVRLLFYLEHAVQDGRTGRDGSQQVVSRRLQFVEMKETGEPSDPGPAPYLDYRPLHDEERRLLQGILEESWLREDMEAKVIGYAIAHLVPQHVEEIRRQRLPLIDKVEREVEARLKTQINYWDRRAQELKAQERAGKKTRLPWQNAAATAEELDNRLDRRRELLQRERQLSALPPVVRGGALVVSGGLLRRLRGEVDPAIDGHDDALRREEIERLAMEAVEEAERELGRIPRNVSDQRGIGYDIERRTRRPGHCTSSR